MNGSNKLELLRLISTITHDAMTCDGPKYRALIEAATKAAGEGVPAYLATFRYLHDNLSALLIDSSTDKT